MKTIIYSILLLVFFLPNTSNAQQTRQEQLVGTWVLDYNASFSKMESRMKARYDSVPTQRKQRIERVYKNRKMNFGADGSFAQSLSDGRRLRGTWSYNSQTRSLVITALNGRSFQLEMLSLSGSGLVVKPKGIGRGTMVLPQLYFTKI